MATLPVKYYASSMPGAPVVSNNWGDLTAMLDACLVTGFAVKGIDSLASSAGVATATVNTGHSYQVGQVIAIAGANEAAYNGEFRVLSTTSTTFTFAIAGAPPSPATGTITARVAPLGWEIAFTGTHKRAYRSTNPASNRHYFRVDDGPKASGYNNTSWAKWAAVGFSEIMTDIDTMSGAQMPYDPAAPSRNWTGADPNYGWFKWYFARSASVNAAETSGDAGTGPRNWVLIGDDRIFYLLINPTPNLAAGGRAFYTAGDLPSFRSADAYNTALCAHDHPSRSATLLNISEAGGIGPARSMETIGNRILRSYTQLGNPVALSATSINLANNQQVSGAGPLSFPNGPDYSLWLLPVYAFEGAGHLRGTFPGLYWVPHNMPYDDMTIVDNVAGLAGRRVLLPQLQNGATAFGAQVAFDITGPWWS
ncbi:MAG: hypothetical protein ACK40S_10955 [Burkholderiaceae bacterium]